MGSIVSCAQTLPNCLTPSEAQAINLALEERDSYFNQIAVLDSTVRELVVQNTDYAVAMIAYKQEAMFYSNGLKVCEQQKENLITTVDKTQKINKKQKKRGTKKTVGAALGGGAGGAAIAVAIILLLK